MSETQKDVLIKYHTQNIDPKSFHINIDFPEPPDYEVIAKILDYFPCGESLLLDVYDDSGADAKSFLFFFRLSHNPKEVAEAIAKIIEESGLNTKLELEEIEIEDDSQEDGKPIGITTDPSRLDYPVVPPLSERKVSRGFSWEPKQ